MRYWLAVWTLWQREVVRFLRQRSRVISTLTQPLLFWVLLGAGLHTSFRLPGAPRDMGYLEYLYPGIMALVLLFTAIFSTISIVEDRREGFLQGVLVAPVPRSSIVLGQALGGATLALGQGALFLIFAPLVGIPLGPASLLASIGSMALAALQMTGLGLIIAWRMESTQGFHAIMNLILMPLWLLSGAFFPAAGAATWLGWVMRLNPLTYAMALMRRCLYLDNPGALAQLPPLLPSLALTCLFCLAILAAAAVTACRHRAV
ncbi:MAG: ABC transporter permease [Acidobacteriota bacterium]